MCKKLILKVLVFIVVLSANHHQLFAQDKKNEVEIISLQIPDSIVFKIKDASNVKVGTVLVQLVSGNRTTQPDKFTSRPSIYRRGVGYIYTDSTQFRATGFNKNFKAEKIRFTIGDKKETFDLVNSAWE
jgi:hypothetical protein